MVATLRPVIGFPWGGLAVGLSCLVPLAWAALAAVGAAWDAPPWQQLFADPQWPKAQMLSIGTGLSATALSWLITAWLLSKSFPGPRWTRLVRSLPPMLAVPHAAFAIGLLFLISPSGWLLRLVSPWATGFAAPPPWLTSQDPWGIGLVAVLVFKEVPFLLWSAAAQLQRADVGQRWTRELQVALSLGYQPSAAWWQVVWPQLWRRLWPPTLAVLAYSLTVVDMALVIGPTSPPTLSVLAWQWLVDADAATNAQGAAAAWWLALTVAVCAGFLWLLRGPVARLGQSGGKRGGQGGWQGGRLSGGQSGRLYAVANRAEPRVAHQVALWALLAVYLAVMLALLVGSVSGVWAFPALLPQSLSWQGWASVLQSRGTVLTTVVLGLAAALTALAWSLAWLELVPPRWDARVRQLIYLPLLLPSVLWVLGIHRLTLAWSIDAQAAGLWMAHSLAAVPYVLIALSPAYLGFDRRYAEVAASLGHRRWAFLLRVKWPLLKAALASSLAVGFAVSASQYLPTLFVGAGRFATVTTEAVTLASGSQRSLTAAYAWLQWLLPVLGFALATWAAQPRRFAPPRNGSPV